MGGGRKNLKRATEEKHVTLQHGQCIMRVVSLRGSNLIEIMDARGQKSLAIFPAKFQKSMWIKRGNFVVVDESGKKEALESGSKVGCIVVQVLVYEQVRALQKSPEWPEIFKQDLKVIATEQQETEAETDIRDDDELPAMEDNTNKIQPFEPPEIFKHDSNERATALQENETDSSDDDGLPPLEANTNRIQPFEPYEDLDSNSDNDDYFVSSHSSANTM